MFKLQFKTDNAAFEDSRNLEISRILFKLANAYEELSKGSDLDGQPIMDINGNRIGTVSDAVDLP